MGWLDKFLGRTDRTDRKPDADDKPPSTVDPKALRKLLFDAVAARDMDTLVAECTQHQSVIAEQFAAWANVPAEFRSREQLAWYGPGLIGVAQIFAQVLNRPEFLEALTGAAENNPLVKWQRALAEVETVIEVGDYREAERTVRALLDETKGLKGTGVDLLRPLTLGRLGECLFQSGDADGARAPMAAALATCEAVDEQPGVRSYLANLYEVERYRGDAVAAAGHLERLIVALDKAGKLKSAASRRRELAIVKAGEPLCRVLVSIDGVAYEVADAPPPPPNGAVQFVFARNRIALRPSTLAVEEGVRAGERGDLDAALACFARAALADRFDPWPHYHRGGTLMLKGSFGDAADAFAQTERLAPGFYHCRADKWLSETAQKGTVHPGVVRVVRQLEDDKLDPEQVVALADRGLARAKLGVLYLARANALTKLGLPRDAEVSYREGLAMTDEPDVRTRLLVGLGAIAESPDEARRVLDEAIALAGNLVAAAMATVMRGAKPKA